jgi:ABC-type protease/lipase transport system fused ATPase/permease subunit
MVTLDISWGPFFLYIGMAIILIVGILVAIIALVVFMVKKDNRRQALAKAPIPEPSGAASEPKK